MPRKIRQMPRWPLVMALLSSSGCALMMNANAHHNSGGTACLASPAFALIDLGIAGASAAIVSASDSSGGWYTVPAVFGAGGVLGLISAARCRGSDTDNPGTVQSAAPASNTAPSFGDAPVDPDVREATPEEMFGPPQKPPPTIGRNGLPIELPPPPQPPPPTVTDEPANPTTPPRPPQSTCTITPRRDCPEGSYCRLVEENSGECIKMN